MKAKFKKRIFRFLIPFSIFLLAIFLRFYKLDQVVNFDFDQEYAANFAYSVVKEYPIQLIGQGLSVQGLFMGPIYFYLLVPFFMLTNLHPFGGFMGSAIFGLITILAYYLVARKVFGEKEALIIAFLRSVLYVELGNDWAMTPAFHAEIPVILTWYFLLEYWKGSSKVFPWIAFIFGFYTSVHPILFPFYFVFLALILIKKRLPKLKMVLKSVIAFLLPLTSLIVFEFLHNFLEVKRLIELFGGPSQEARDLGRIAKYISFIFSEPRRVLGLNNIPLVIFSVLLLSLILFLVKKKIGFWKEKFHPTIIALTFLVFVAYYYFFPGHVPEYYFIALSSFSILYVGATLGLLLKNKIGTILVLLILLNIFLINFNILQNRWNNEKRVGLYDKDKIVQEIVKRQDVGSEFYVSYIKLLGWDFGFNYLFKYYNRIPQTVVAKPPVYTIVIPKDLSIDSIDISSHGVGLILPEEEK